MVKMGVAPGGKIQQIIHEVGPGPQSQCVRMSAARLQLRQDKSSSAARWDTESGAGARVFIHLVNAEQWRGVAAIALAMGLSVSGCVCYLPRSGR